MNEVIAWVTFAGAWLLVAGPLYQGSVELDELDVDREGIEGIKASAVQTAQGRPSPWWWWLLPPVMYVLHRRWTRAFRQATFAQLAGRGVLAADRGDARPGAAQHAVRKISDERTRGSVSAEPASTAEQR
jgi:hypothetical protein